MDILYIEFVLFLCVDIITLINMDNIESEHCHEHCRKDIINKLYKNYLRCIYNVNSVGYHVYAIGERR